MTRSLWKGPFICNFILKQVYKQKNQTVFKLIKVWSKNSMIFPSFVGLNFEVYNGKQFILLNVKENMIGAKFGEFISTKKLAKHKRKD
jgi:small subunit ribosomal protein S19